MKPLHDPRVDQAEATTAQPIVPVAPAPPWIRVTPGTLPPHGVEVFYCWRFTPTHITYGTARWVPSKGKWVMGGYYYDKEEAPDFWMPIPGLPPDPETGEAL
jgi:hypothetical protein